MARRKQPTTFKALCKPVPRDHFLDPGDRLRGRPGCRGSRVEGGLTDESIKLEPGCAVIVNDKRVLVVKEIRPSGKILLEGTTIPIHQSTVRVVMSKELVKQAREEQSRRALAEARRIIKKIQRLLCEGPLEVPADLW